MKICGKNVQVEIVSLLEKANKRKLSFWNHMHYCS